MKKQYSLTGIIAIGHHSAWQLFQTGLDAAILRQKQTEERIRAQKADMPEFLSKQTGETASLSDLLSSIRCLSSRSAAEHSSLLRFSFVQSEDNPFLQELFSVSPEYILSDFLDGITRNAYCYRRDSLRIFVAACLKMDTVSAEVRIGPEDVQRCSVDLNPFPSDICELFDQCDIEPTEKRTSYLSVFESSYFDMIR